MTFSHAREITCLISRQQQKIMEIFKGVQAQRETSMKTQERYPKIVSYRWHHINEVVPHGTLYANDMYKLTSEILVGNKRHAQNRDGNHTS